MGQETNEPLIRRACRYMEAHSRDGIRVDEVADHVGMSRFHFQRSFKTIVGTTPKQYLAAAQLKAFKTRLKSAKGVTVAAYDAGYGSPSQIYDGLNARLGMTPKQYRQAGEGVTISYATIDTLLGLLMIGATDRGVCFVQFGESVEALLVSLRSEYPKASIEAIRTPHHPDFDRWVNALQRYLEGRRPHVDLPLDIRGTAFQLRVWKYLQSIPYGEVQSYHEVATAIGAPTAARAVARACATNPVPLIVPCHRVVRGTGEVGGYRFGSPRKRALLDLERTSRARSAEVR
jgi:AraC family transcriptional regulator of adaptative response/methylated-DNA-[protein]-cysteine methyltransferase